MANNGVEVFPKGFLKNYHPFIITDVFGSPRKNRKHNGVDIGCPSGTVILSPYDAVVHRVGMDKNGYGLYVIIRHRYSIDSFVDVVFAHLSKTSSGLYQSKNVKKGETLAYTGGAKGDKNAGRSTGAHLHLEIRKNGTNVINPIPFLYKTKCITKKNNYVLGNGGVYKEGFKYTLTDDDFESIFYTSDVTNKETYWAATEKDIIEKSNPSSTKERLAPGIWQIIKLLIDSSVENKQVLDSSISVQSGSLINFFRKTCQYPLVEFMGDTFGNKYYWIVRKPPFDREGFLKMSELTLIDLTEDKILSSDLSWNNKDIFSWYQYIPYADFFEESNLQIPAVFFPEYASVWGSKPLSIESNYFHFLSSGRFDVNNKEENKANSDRIMRNAIKDFKFLIESNSYNPFTRFGTINIVGDRRIKRGTLIRHITGEIFYVDSVVNSYEVSSGNTSRITSLNVSRGMYPSFINGRQIGGKEISYFNLIDFGKDFDIEKITSDNWRSVISKWKVNLDSFGFFLTKQQVWWENINAIRDDYNLLKPVEIIAKK